LPRGEKVSVAEINQLKRDAKEKEALIQKIRKQRDDWKANGKTQIDNLSKRIAEADAEKAKAINVAIRAERENTQEQIRTHKRAVNLAKVDMDKLKLKHKKSIDDEVKVHIRTHHEHLFLCIVNTDSYRT
jgi:DNA-directed RNA polymerase alpha subunit